MRGVCLRRSKRSSIDSLTVWRIEKPKIFRIWLRRRYYDIFSSCVCISLKQTPLMECSTISENGRRSATSRRQRWKNYFGICCIWTYASHKNNTLRHINDKNQQKLISCSLINYFETTTYYYY